MGVEGSIEVPACVAVDWSGAADPGAQRRGIWIGRAVGGSLVSLRGGWTRAEAVDEVLRMLDAAPHTVVALDFGFSYPAWWVRLVGATDGPSLWDVAGSGDRSLGEEWLASCEPPFWGRPGRPRPASTPERPEYRRTELPSPTRPWGRPKSMFQIGGAGSVGTGSIRGMPVLRRLRTAGVAIWPFDPVPADGGPMAVEAYPRWCTGRVVKSSVSARSTHLAAAWPGLIRAHRAAATASEDAFDAACTALVLSAGVGTGPPIDETDLVEGRVVEPISWRPPTPTHTSPSKTSGRWP